MHFFSCFISWFLFSSLPPLNIFTIPSCFCQLFLPFFHSLAYIFFFYSPTQPLLSWFNPQHFLTFFSFPFTFSLALHSSPSAFTLIPIFLRLACPPLSLPLHTLPLFSSGFLILLPLFHLTIFNTGYIFLPCLLKFSSRFFLPVLIKYFSTSFYTAYCNISWCCYKGISPLPLPHLSLTLFTALRGYAVPWENSSTSSLKHATKPTPRLSLYE